MRCPSRRNHGDVCCFSLKLLRRYPAKVIVAIKIFSMMKIICFSATESLQFSGRELVAEISLHVEAVYMFRFVGFATIFLNNSMSNAQTLWLFLCINFLLILTLRYPQTTGISKPELLLRMNVKKPFRRNEILYLLT